MLKSVEFLQDFRGFSAGLRLDFRPGVNLLVGDQGAGKTTLLSTLVHRKNFSSTVAWEVKGEISFLAYDAEKDNPRTASTFDPFAVASRFQSHGETMNCLLESFLAAVTSQKARCPAATPLVLLDEPDLGLSIRSCYKLRGLLRSLEGLGAQILCAVHNPLVIEHFEDVLDVEARHWCSSQAFIFSQKGLASVSPKKVT